jgi:hypothetical protein
VWEGITTSEVSFPGGKKLILSPQDWKDFVKWAYSHIDGPPKVELDLTSAGQPMKVIIEYADNDNTTETTPGAGTDKAGTETL